MLYMTLSHPFCTLQKGGPITMWFTIEFGNGCSTPVTHCHILLSFVSTTPTMSDSDHVQHRQTYSEDLRERVIYQKYSLHKKTADIAHDLNISVCVVQRVLQLWRKSGEVIPVGPGWSNKRRRMMMPHEQEVCI